MVTSTLAHILLNIDTYPRHSIVFPTTLLTGNYDVKVQRTEVGTRHQLWTVGRQKGSSKFVKGPWKG